MIKSADTKVDRFTAGLDDLTRKQQSDPEAVLAVLRRSKRYSVFEATDNQVIAVMMTGLVRRGRLTVDTSCGYPWTRVVAIDGVPLEISATKAGI